jgi:hypothetical protein
LIKEEMEMEIKKYEKTELNERIIKLKNNLLKKLDYLRFEINTDIICDLEYEELNEEEQQLLDITWKIVNSIEEFDDLVRTLYYKKEV